MTIDEPFTTDLQNPQSEEFINMTSRFRLFLIPLYQNETWFIDIMVNSFSNGSIIADIDVLYNTTEATPTVEDIQAPIIAAINNGSAPFAIQNLTVTFSANTTATTPGTTGATTSVTKKSNKGDDGFETWEIALVVSLAVVLLVLVLVSILIIFLKRTRKWPGYARYNLENRRNSFDLDYNLYSHDADKPYSNPTNGIANYAQSMEINEKGESFL
ncbi:Hypothetical predicted protein [Paramuricea clavata]|uniref:Uncharacterized protein n=1 Tax=Paramuricea clavata TaxID=317549 RepID=A0A6S7KBF6_PARCT|nr:Hypothetical predicted protein [Paramuricea clavata]